MSLVRAAYLAFFWLILKLEVGTKIRETLSY